MKKLILLLSVALCSATFLSCEKETKDDSDTPGDTWPPLTLAGSISMSIYSVLAAEGSYDGDVLTDFNQYSYIDTGTVSDAEISMTIWLIWGERRMLIEIPAIPLTGKPYDVAFDVTSDKVKLTNNDVLHTKVSATVKGWIREKSIKPPKSSVSRTSYPIYAYNCDITIECELDGKPLTLKITELGGPPGYSI